MNNVEEMIKIGLYGSVSALLLLSSFVLLVVGCYLKKEQLSNPSQELKDLRARKEQILERINNCVEDIKLPTEVEIVKKTDIKMSRELKSLVDELYDSRLKILQSVKDLYMCLKEHVKGNKKSYSSSSFDKDQFATKREDFCKRSDKLYYRVKSLLDDSYKIENQIIDKIDTLKEEKKISQNVINELESYLYDSLLEDKLEEFNVSEESYLSCVMELVGCISKIQELEKTPTSSLSNTSISSEKPIQQVQIM